ncbi:MAG: hypothetical protein HQK49_13230 [Oligoflexia bacterium]|nr:hypothetical protein [Oligoflexia bacterium]
MIRKLVLFLLSATLLASCSQFVWRAEYKTEYLNKFNQDQQEKNKQKLIEENKKIAIENKKAEEEYLKSENVIDAKKNNSKIKIELKQEIPANHFSITNNYNQPIRISYNESSLILGSESSRVVSGETKRIHSSLSVPDLIIPPNTTSKFSFYRSDTSVSDLSHLYSKMMIAIKIGEKTQYYYHLRAPTEKPLLKEKSLSHEPYAEFYTEIKSSDKTTCYVTAILWGGYCWFMKPDENDTKNAKEKFIKESGLNENLFDLKYQGKK